MTNFDTSHVKNIVLLGHAGSGKTTLAECMLYEADIIHAAAALPKEILQEITTNWNRNVVILFLASSSTADGEVIKLIFLIHRDMMTLSGR